MMVGTDEVLVRDMVDDDVAAVSRLIGHTAFVSNRHEYPASVLRELCEWYSIDNIRRLAGQRIWLVAELDAAILGTVAIELPTEGDDHADLASFFIAPSAQGKGIGRKLLDQAVVRSRDLGVDRLVCDSSLTAEGFYARHGWTVLRRVDKGDGDVCIDMQYLLS